MKITEIHQTGTTDDEALEAHSRTSVKLSYEVSFAHEQGLEPVFTELLQHGVFKTQLEAEFTAKFKELAQRMIRSSSIPIGHGWMDDFEAEILVNGVDSQQID